MTLCRSLLASGIVLSMSAPPSTVSAPSQKPEARGVREQIFRELQPVALKNCTLKRYGSPNDGGYLMCANLIAGATSVYSYGIASEDNWGCQVSKELKVPVHQYDCFTPDRPACPGGVARFNAECVGAKKEVIDGKPFDTIANQIARNGDAGKTILLKIDVEGAEWDSLRATPDAVLDRILQMPMEFHGTDEPRFAETIRKLMKKFYVVNLHYNNNACAPTFAPMVGFAYQALLVNKRIGILDTSVKPPAPPSPLNAPDNPALPECQPSGKSPLLKRPGGF